MSPLHALRLTALSAATALLLVACGGGGGGETTHENTAIDTAGRLAVAENGARTLRIHDLDNAGAVEASHTLDNAPSAVYASPNGRYAVAMQRLQDLTQFVDGGVWQEDHGDHLHDYRQPSRAVSWKLAGVRPTHYDRQAGRQAAIFMDGNAAAAPVQNAGVRLLTDAGIGSGQLTASLDLAAPIHGLGEPVDNKLLVSVRAADATDASPTHLALYQRNAGAYTLTRQVPTRCDGMHGSFSSGNSTVAGCRDGVLAVRHTGAATVDDGRKLTTPVRVSTIAGHPRLPDQFIGFGNEGTAPAPVTTRFYAVDAAAGAASALNPQGWDTGRVQRAYAFDRSGQRFLVLDDAGTLYVLQRQGAGWATAARVAGAIASMPSAAPFPALTANGARDEVYLTDPAASQLVVLNAANGTVTARRSLGYVPSALAWLGITR